MEASKVIYTKKTEDDINITRSDPQPSCCREFDKSDRINSQDLKNTCKISLFKVKSLSYDISSMSEKNML